MIQGLEEEPQIKFAMENPATSQMWALEIITKALERNKNWRLVTVDQCAYGRKSQKPTKILTNLQEWEPRGQTGTGRCSIGKCAGTEPGQKDRKHKEQTVPNSKERRPSQGDKQKGRWDYTKEAVTNAVAEALVQEIMEAAIREGR